LRQHQQESDVAHLLKLLATRVQQDKLIEPAKDCAVYYLARAREAGATAQELQAAEQTLGQRLTLAARASIDQHLAGDIQRLIDEARGMGVAQKVVAALQRDFEAMRESQTRDRAQRAQILELAQRRLAQDELIEPSEDSALFYVDQLRGADPQAADSVQVAAALGRALAADARAAIAAADLVKAEALIKAAGGLAAAGDLDDVKELFAEQKLKLGHDAQVASTTLIAQKPLRLEYPQAALAKGTEGWVDLAFEVTSEGRVRNISVVGASPKNVFEAAAESAVSRVRYKPVMIEGRAAAIRTTLHVVFRMDQQ
jgi:TonB family protein